ncbi:MAG: hypothetical protein CVU84_15500 [Firmicutes bacterium HGW-Firmicutes-1]|jgi:hypothetical protein|nr:MAG: hypothetical protein CVU84_15500 [Firmicutes bacterium HGW-Firmicutes-1]
MKFFNKIKKALKKRTRVEVEILQGIDLENMFTSEEVGETIRARVQASIQKKQDLKPKYEHIINQLTLVQKIEDLPKDEIQELESLSRLYSETVLEKETFQKLLKNQNTATNYLQKYKDEISNAVVQMEEHETKLSIIKNDLYHLEGEKAEIAYRNNRALAALAFIKIALVGMIILSSIAALILTTMFFVYGFDVFLPSLVVTVLVGFMGLWIFVFRRYLVHELKKNQKLQKREVELTNKTKIKYVNIQQFLDYEYKKFRVNSSEMLQMRWENYQNNSRNEAKFKRISSSMATLIEDLDRLLLRNNIEGGSFVTDHIDYFISKKGRNMLQTALELEKDSTKVAYDQCENEILILSRLLEEIMDNELSI